MGQKYTTLEQSTYLNKRIGSSTADMMYISDESGKYSLEYKPYDSIHHSTNKKYPDLPCWSLGALIEDVLPSEITKGSTRFILDVRPIHSMSTDLNTKVCTVGYRSFDFSGATLKNLYVKVGESLFETVYELIKTLIIQSEL